MGVHTKTSSPKITSAFARSKRRFSLPTWTEVLAAAPPKIYGRDVEIFGQQEPAEYLYKVVSGAVRTCSVLRDGRRHIAEFYLAGDFSALKPTSHTHCPPRPFATQKFLSSSAMC